MPGPSRTAATRSWCRAGSKHFGTLHVLRSIDLTVHRGGAVVVVGPSGSGKSTPCRAINRLENHRAVRGAARGPPARSSARALEEPAAPGERGDRPGNP
ncbi:MULTISPECIES: ATP-binding cassette domain-containing protein [unclassified Streptomyces]|uniref:ATP-binding cassette domain-containing protein n=1 Tax=unclassified Streptomyces TaxID=2593676 RepID=UPI0038028614